VSITISERESKSSENPASSLENFAALQTSKSTPSLKVLVKERFALFWDIHTQMTKFL
jgi:hypothetical protein